MKLILACLVFFKGPVQLLHHALPASDFLAHYKNTQRTLSFISCNCC